MILDGTGSAFLVYLCLNSHCCMIVKLVFFSLKFESEFSGQSASLHLSKYLPLLVKLLT